jgi:NodT family efflux transporter outer membrane factor (OMF) lipoprotein
MSRLYWIRSLVLIASMGLQLSACAFFPRQAFPEQAAKPINALEPKLAAQANPIEDAWWKAFGDAQLNQLVELGLKHSPSLDTSGARIVAAQAMLETERAAFIPQVSVGGQVDRQQLSQNYIFVPGMPIYTGYGLANASLNWSLDIWGKQKKYFDAAKNQVLVAQANYKASELLLSTTIVRVYFDYDHMIQAQALYSRELEIRKNLLRIAIERQRAGLSDTIAVNQRKVELESAQANVNQANLSVRMMQHQLAALVQEGPSWGESLKAPSIQATKLSLPEVIPSDLLERRPDLQALLSQIDVAKLQLDGSKLEYLPDINLAGFIGVQSFGLSQMFSSRSQQFSIGPAINLPIFDGGLIDANITGKEANRNQAIASYQEQLVQALREVADGIGSVKSTQANYQSFANAELTAKRNFEITRSRSEVGIASKETTLTVEQSYLMQGQNFADAKTKMLTANVVLVQALGGSYLQSKTQTTANGQTQ